MPALLPVVVRLFPFILVDSGCPGCLGYCPTRTTVGYVVTLLVPHVYGLHCRVGSVRPVTVVARWFGWLPFAVTPPHVAVEHAPVTGLRLDCVAGCSCLTRC